MGKYDPDVATGVNLLKARARGIRHPGHQPGVLTGCASVRSLTPAVQTGSDPRLGSDDAYPAWLWTLAAPREPLSALERRFKSSGGEALEVEEGLRLVRLKRKAGIKASNASGGGE